jgi:glycerol-3-phosphate acyltransferase PlsY
VSAAILGDDIRFPMYLAFALLVIWKHRENLYRLKAGKEPRVGRKQA